MTGTAEVTHDIITRFYLQTPPSQLPSPAGSPLQPPPPSLRLGEWAGTWCLLRGSLQGPQLLPGLLTGTCAQLLLGPEARAFSRDPESPGRWRVWTSMLHKAMLGLHGAVNGSARSNPFQNAGGTACGSLTKQLPKGSFFSLEEQVCIYLISISIGRYPGLDPPILSVSLL